MGFFEKIRIGRLYFGKKKPSMVVKFIFKGKKYIVEEFDLCFSQDVDHKGNPDSFPKGGLITVIMSDIPDDSINWWMMDSLSIQDGEFRFFKNEGKINEGFLLQVQFKDASCASYQKTMNPQGAGVLTTLVISPRYLRIGNEEFERR